MALGPVHRRLSVSGRSRGLFRVWYTTGIGKFWFGRISAQRKNGAQSGVFRPNSLLEIRLDDWMDHGGFEGHWGAYLVDWLYQFTDLRSRGYLDEDG